MITLTVFSVILVTQSISKILVANGDGDVITNVNGANDIDGNGGGEDLPPVGGNDLNDITEQNNSPETPLKPSGPTFIEVGVEYTFMSSTYDTNGGQIRYRFDWGDGNYSNWSDFMSSNTSVSMSHHWSSISNYSIRVMVQDENSMNSSWSNVLIAKVSQANSGEIPLITDDSNGNVINDTSDKDNWSNDKSQNGDDFYTFIRNSNGNYWEPTGANIQAAIDDIGSNGAVWIPPGEFMVSSSIEIKRPGIAIRGAGIEVTKIIAQSGGSFVQGVIYVHHHNNVPPHGFQISNLSIDGNNASSLSGLTTADSPDIYNVNITNIRVCNTTVHGFSLRVLYKPVLSGLIAENIGYNGIDVYTSYGCMIINPYCRNCNNYGIDLVVKSGGNIIIGGHLTDCGNSTQNGGIAIAGDNNTIYDLDCYKNNYNGASIIGHNNTIHISCRYNSNDGLILVGTGNYIDVLSENNGAFGINVPLRAARYNLITGKISNNGDDGISFSHAGNNTVREAIIDSNTGRGIGFRFSDASNNIIKDCQFINTNGGQSIHTAGYDGASIYDNTVKDNTYSVIVE